MQEKQRILDGLLLKQRQTKGNRAYVEDSDSDSDDIAEVFSSDEEEDDSLLVKIKELTDEIKKDSEGKETFEELGKYFNGCRTLIVKGYPNMSTASIEDFLIDSIRKDEI